MPRDHFDRKVEDSLRRDLPIITTPHAYHHLAEAKEGAEAFTCVHPLDHFESLCIDIANQLEGGTGSGQTKRTAVKVTGMPGKHVPPGPAHILSAVNDLLGMVPPTNGWMVELGYTVTSAGDESFECGYRIYISGDTLMVDELKEIPERYRDQKIDLMLVHLGGLFHIYRALRADTGQRRRNVDPSCQSTSPNGDYGCNSRPSTGSAD